MATGQSDYKYLMFDGRSDEGWGVNQPNIRCYKNVYDYTQKPIHNRSHPASASALRFLAHLSDNYCPFSFPCLTLKAWFKRSISSFI